MGWCGSSVGGCEKGWDRGSGVGRYESGVVGARAMLEVRAMWEEEKAGVVWERCVCMWEDNVSGVRGCGDDVGGCGSGVGGRGSDLGRCARGYGDMRGCGNDVGGCGSNM